MAAGRWWCGGERGVHNADRTSSLTIYDGAQMRAIGVLGGAIPYNVWVRGGRVVEVAANLQLFELVV
ncbi:MAG: hypothetical protein IE915_04685 [Stenotrophomonas sp.]|nr:hypothetical protein [Stenotrophomonas sp.]